MSDECTEAEALADQLDGDNCETTTRYYPRNRRYRGLSEGKRKSLYTRRHVAGGAPLTKEVLESRKGNPAWCQRCLKRRVNKGYTCCFWCS